MKTRIHIHSETIEDATEERHFQIKLPPDAEKIISLKVTVSAGDFGTGYGGGGGEVPPVGGVGGGHGRNPSHIAMGNICFSCDGVLFCELQVLFEGYEPSGIISTPSVIESSTKTYVSGGKYFALALDVPLPSPVIFCKYENGAFSNYPLTILITYEPTTKQ